MYTRNLFSKRLIELRTANGLFQKHVAEALQITVQAYSLLETDKRSPSFEVLIALADYFCVSLDYLTGRSDDPQTEIYLSKTKLKLREQICSIDDLDFANTLFDMLLLTDSSKVEDQIGVINSLKNHLSSLPHQTTFKPKALTHTASQDNFQILGTKVNCHLGFWLEKSAEELRPAKCHYFLIFTDALNHPGYLSHLLVSSELDRDELTKFVIETKLFVRRIEKNEQYQIAPYKRIVKFKGEYKDIHIENGAITFQEVDDAEKIAAWVSTQGLHIADI